MDFDELKPLLLPSTIGDCISSRTDSDGALPMNLSSQLIDKISNDPVRAERLVAQAEAIWDHLASGMAGWGQWPSGVEDSLFIGFLLGLWVQQGVEELIVKLSEGRLSVLEDHCRQKGLSVEQFLIEHIVEGIEGRKDLL
jgi:hypothetical protein